MATTSDQAPGGWSPPYVPFKTLINLIVKMEEDGIPTRLDKSFLSYLSGGTQSHLWASMRSLGLIDDERAPTTALAELVAAGPGQRRWPAPSQGQGHRYR